MKKQKSITAALSLFAIVASATIASGDTAPLAASSPKKRVSATTTTTTTTTATVVTAPVVETKIEATNTWVAEPTETAATTVIMTLEEPIKPFIPLIAALISADCNGNGTPDSTEIANGAHDVDNDQILDACEYYLGDLNLNGIIDAQDVSILLGWWGIADPVFGDLNDDNQVNAIDLGIILGRFGAVTY